MNRDKQEKCRRLAVLDQVTDLCEQHGITYCYYVSFLRTLHTIWRLPEATPQPPDRPAPNRPQIEG